MSRVAVAVAGETATVDYTVDALPVLPEVAWSTLNPVSGQHIGVALKKLASEARVVLPAGDYSIADNTDVNNYSVYAPKALGLRGAGIDKTVIRVKANSFTYKVSRPKDAGAGLLRYGPNNGSSGKVRTMSDVTFVGAPQAGPDGLPMFSSGLINYMGRGEVWQRVRVRGLAYGGGNSPNTGETFMVNDYRTTDQMYLDLDLDGRDEAGNMVSGSPLGFNGSIRPTVKRSYIHHSLYSGLTFSIAGTVATPTVDPTTEDVRIEMNANHPGVGSGGRFSGINHEWVRGQITHIRPSIQLDQAHLWDSNHISHGCDQLPDNPVPMFIDNPTWFASPTWANGAFTVKLWGNQSTLPIVRNADGSLKKAVVVAGQSPARRVIDPLTEFAVSVGTGYVAP
jgi:hypothetical protein